MFENNTQSTLTSSYDLLGSSLFSLVQKIHITYHLCSFINCDVPFLSAIMHEVTFSFAKNKIQDYDQI